MSEDKPKVHGAVGSGPVSSPCPKCGYAYADGGYCGDCGWMRAVRLDPYGTHSGQIRRRRRRPA
jgi:hypothetical protein